MDERDSRRLRISHDKGPLDVESRLAKARVVSMADRREGLTLPDCVARHNMPDHPNAWIDGVFGARAPRAEYEDGHADVSSVNALYDPRSRRTDLHFGGSTSPELLRPLQG